MTDSESSKPNPLFDLVEERYGARLSPEELEEVRKGVESVSSLADTLRKVKVESGDEPFSMFTPYRKEE